MTWRAIRLLLLAALIPALLLTGVVPSATATRGGHATGTFTITTWHETTLGELPGGARLIHVYATDTFAGGIVGEAQAEEEHLIRRDDTRVFTGMIVITGRLGRREGSFVVLTSGTFDGRTARSEWRVVPGSGTGELRGLRGVGTDQVTVGQSGVHYTLRYWFDHG